MVAEYAERKPLGREEGRLQNIGVFADEIAEHLDRPIDDHARIRRAKIRHASAARHDRLAQPVEAPDQLVPPDATPAQRQQHRRHERGRHRDRDGVDLGEDAIAERAQDGHLRRRRARRGGALATFDLTGKEVAQAEWVGEAHVHAAHFEVEQIRRREQAEERLGLLGRAEQLGDVARALDDLRRQREQR